MHTFTYWVEILYIFEYILFFVIHSHLLNFTAMITSEGKKNDHLKGVESFICLFLFFTDQWFTRRPQTICKKVNEIISDFRSTSIVEPIRVIESIYYSKRWFEWIQFKSFPEKKGVFGNKRTFTTELLITRIFIKGVWCEGKGNRLCSTPLSFENEKWHGWTALSPKLVDLRQGPGVIEGCSAITMLLVFSPHISLLQCSSALMCYFVLFLILWNNVMLAVRAVPLRSHQNASWTAVRLQMANAKVPFFYKLPKQKAERTLSRLSSHSSPLDLSQTHSHFLNKTYPDTWVITSVERRNRHRSCVSGLLKLNNFLCYFFKIHHHKGSVVLTSILRLLQGLFCFKAWDPKA